MKKVSLSILFMITMSVILSGCFGDKEITPAEKASVVSENLADTYFSLHSSYKRLESVLTGEKLEKLKEAAPVMNKIKKHLKAYNDLVIEWRVIGGEKPMELITEEKLLTPLLNEASAIILEFL